MLLPVIRKRKRELLSSASKQNFEPFLKRVEEFFDVPHGSITRLNKKAGQPKRLENSNVSICHIRQSLSHYLRIEKKLTVEDIAKIVGFSAHGGICRAIQAAQSYLDTNDPQFKWYYERIVSMIWPFTPARESHMKISTSNYSLPRSVRKRKISNL